MPKQGEKFTEFYILGKNKTASEYPTNLMVGEYGEIIIGIVNHEYKNESYQLEIKLNEKLLDTRTVELVHNETWESPFIFQVEEKGKDQKLELFLYNSTRNLGVYRSLHLWVDVS